MSGFIALRGVTKAFGGMTVVDGLDLDVARGEFVSLLGPSGSGKTTILMMLGGFETLTAGQITLDGRRIDRLPPHRRGMGVVFQNYALFPHMSVAENVAFPLEMRGMPKREIGPRVTRALEIVRMAHLADRRPAQLSGGQQQRAALTRAMVFEPAVILMDEPLGALDKQLREEMQLEIRDLHRRLGLTVVFVTHDQSEALTMSDRIAVFNAGRIAQIDTPAGIYDAPRSRFVAEFIGETNLIHAHPRPHAASVEGVPIVAADGRTLALGPEAGPVLISLRPERIELRPTEGVGSGTNALAAVVTDCVYQGDHLRVHLRAAPAGLDLIVRCERRGSEWRTGDAVTARFTPQDCRVIEA